MAGEWIAYDLALPDKPEVQELIDTTGLPVQDVVFNLLKLWGWASMHTADGTARMTLARLVRTCGATEAFWVAVAGVGWLEIDQQSATVSVPGWDLRFSHAAKSRLQKADRSRAYEDRNPGRKQVSAPSGASASGASGAHAPDGPALERRRGEEKREEIPPLPREGFDKAAWHTLRKAWNAGKGKPWKPVNPHPKAVERMSEPGWLDDALAAIQRLPQCQFFKTAVSLGQFCGPDFVTLCNGGDYDDRQDRGSRRDFAESPPPPKVFSGEAAEAFERTRRHLAESQKAIQ